MLTNAHQSRGGVAGRRLLVGLVVALFAWAALVGVARAAVPGTISTVAGVGLYGALGNAGPATSGEVAWPSDTVDDPGGDMFIADYGGQRVREVTTNDPPPVCYEAGARAVGEYGFTGTRDQEDVVVYAPSGLRSISDVTVVNGRASYKPFDLGTKGPVVVTATKTDESTGVSGYYKATDDRGQYSFCGFYIQSSF